MWRPSFSGTLTAAGGVLAVVIGLAAVDERVRFGVVRMFQRRAPTSELAAASEHVESFAMVLLQAIRYQSIEHAPLVIFALAAAVLVLFMLRTHA